MTTLKTLKVKIGNKIFTVNQMKGKGEQEILYQINGNKPIPSNKFWKMKPVKI